MPDPAAPELDAEAARKAGHKLEASTEVDKARPATTMTEDEKIAYMQARSKLAQRGDMFHRKPYSAADTDAMIKAKDQRALSSTGSTSRLRNVQSVGSAAHTVQDVASSIGGEFLDKVTGLPIASTADALALGTEAGTMKIAQNDSRRQEVARIDQVQAAEAHQQSHDALTQMRGDLADFHASGGVTPEDRSPRLATGSGLRAFQGVGNAVIAHNTARRSGKSAGRGKDMIKPMSMDHSLGEEVAQINGKAVVDDGTVIGDDYTAAVRDKKEQRKQAIAADKQTLKDRQTARKMGLPDSEFDAHMKGLQEEKDKHSTELQALKDKQKSRDQFGRSVGRGYALTQDEQNEKATSETAMKEINARIDSAHEEHTSGILGRMSALEETGQKQKEADRYRSGKKGIFGGAIREEFSRKGEMRDLESQRDEIRGRQTEAIEAKLAKAKTALEGSSDEAAKQRIQDQIAQHESLLAKSKSDSTFVSPQYLKIDDKKALQSKLAQLASLQREKDTGLTSDQQKEHDQLRATLDAAKASGTAGASAEDLRARDEHQATLNNLQNLSKHGLTLDESAQKAKLKKRLASIYTTETEKLTEQERADLAGLKQERQGLKGMNTKARKFAKTHESERVVDGRVGGVGTEHNQARDVTSTGDKIGSFINHRAKNLNTAGEIVEANLDKGREAAARGDADHAMAIAGAKVGQNIAGIVGGALGVPELDSTIEKVGQGMQGVAKITGAASYEAADRAKFAEHARSMIPDEDGKTDRFHQVQHGVIDFHGAEDAPFARDGLSEGAKQLASAVKDPLSDALGDPLNAAASSAVGAVQEHVVDPAHRALSSAANVVRDGVAPVADAASSAVGAVQEHVVDPAQQALSSAADAVHEHVIEPSVDAASEMAEEKGQDHLQGEAQRLWDERHKPEERTDPVTAPTTESKVPAPAPTHDPQPTPGTPDPAGPTPGSQRLPWWKRMWNAVKRGARSVGRGVRNVGNSIRRGVSAAGQWFRGLFS